MASRIPAPDNLGDLEETILPSRACLLALRDTARPARQLALEDAVREAKRLRSSSNRDRVNTYALACLWEAVACLELAANIAAPWVDPQTPSEKGAWAELTIYDGGRANRFYESSHNWTDARFAVLAGFRFREGNDDSLVESMQEFGMLDEDLAESYRVAEEATARFLRRRFVHLQEWWKVMRGYAASFEHGLLFVPSAVGDVVDGDGEVIPHSILAFESRRDQSRGHAGDDATAAIQQAQHAGALALDVVEHVADSRLSVVEALEFDDGKVFMRPWKDPIPWWFEKGDVAQEHLDRLRKGLTIGWIEEAPLPEEAIPAGLNDPGFSEG